MEQQAPDEQLCALKRYRLRGINLINGHFD